MCYESYWGHSEWVSLPQGKAVLPQDLGPVGCDTLATTNLAYFKQAFIGDVLMFSMEEGIPNDRPYLTD